ncbi:hypothetical protein yberc0001_20000 [Yersinia bercovieri ATCC 43970]|uniref:Uncharacterized protein n=1 Tax=Yersinia bercovieri ATCC 43970 TaxID=349968 RepID=A0ABP2E5A2_YERBE|nr:hypothetical protein yberc0001_20000 [Yersinia bercovieri ATCC 43970]
MTYLKNNIIATRNTLNTHHFETLAACQYLPPALPFAP